MTARQLFVSMAMPRDGELAYIPVMEYVVGRYTDHEIAAISGVLSDIHAQRPSADYKVGLSGNSLWLTINRESPEEIKVDLQLYWRTSRDTP